MINGVLMCEHTIMDRLCAQSDLHYRDNSGCLTYTHGIDELCVRDEHMGNLCVHMCVHMWIRGMVKQCV
jgi:hypothetical protein